METKVCTSCNEEKPLSEFGIRKYTRALKDEAKTYAHIQSICKSCSRIKALKSKRKAAKRNKSMEE